MCMYNSFHRKWFMCIPIEYHSYKYRTLTQGAFAAQTNNAKLDVDNDSTLVLLQASCSNTARRLQYCCKIVAVLLQLACSNIVIKGFE